MFLSSEKSGEKATHIHTKNKCIYLVVVVLLLKRAGRIRSLSLSCTLSLVQPLKKCDSDSGSRKTSCSSHSKRETEREKKIYI